MPKEEKTVSAAVGLGADWHSDTEQDIAALATAVGDQDIASLAYEFWLARGCPEGSPDEDWFHALEQLRSRNPAEQAAAAVEAHGTKSRN